MYRDGQGVPRNYAEALKWFRKAADQGDDEAQNNLGSLYYEGKGVPQNYAEASKWYRKAANQGSALAQNYLGVMYTKGEGVPRNYAKAVKWYRLAANQGNNVAQYNLGFMYANGQGVQQNYAEALKWYRKAADQRDDIAAIAMNNLGVMYAKGEGVPQNFAEAVNWYRKAADQGYALAQSNLGDMYDLGHGVPQNYAEALKWYRKAAGQGYALAQWSLGLKYDTGQGVPQNYVRAHMWYNLAASNPSSEKNTRDVTVRNRDLVASKMTPAQIAQAQTLSEQCLRSKYRDCGLGQVARREDKVAPPKARNEVASTGTGFFVSEAGHIVTNAHVVEGCQTVRSSRGGPLRRVSVDEESDLALYIASEKPEAIARLRGAHGARAGESVVAVGFPLSGLLSSDLIVTTGTISALSGLRNDRRRLQITR